MTKYFCLQVGFFLLLAVFFLSCDDSPDDHVAEILVLVPSDTVISIGSNPIDSIYAFADFQQLGDNILILDHIAGRIVKLNPEDSSVSFIGRSGQGPGELSRPICFVVCGDLIRVVDAGKGMVCFNMNGDYSHEHSFFANNLPVSLIPTIENKYLGILMENSINDSGELESKVSVALFGEAESALVNFISTSVELDFMDMDNTMYEVINAYHYTADPRSGIVYISPSSPDNSTIIGFSSNGDIEFQLQVDIDPVRRTSTEIEAESRSFINDPLTRNFTPGEVEIPEFMPQITELGVDSIGNLWVRDGTERVPTFIVLSHENRDTLFTAVAASLDNEGSLYKSKMSQYGLLISELDHEGFQHLYRIHFAECRDSL